MTYEEALQKLSRLIDPDATLGIPESILEDALAERERFGVHATATAYAVGDRVIPSPATGRLYRCTVAGTSGATAPEWPTGSRISTWKLTDGETLVWEDAGPISTSRRWDLDGAAFDACMAMARRSASKVDVTDNGVTVKRSQAMTNWTAMAASFSLSSEIF